jgi:GAF domain-containing protein
MTDTWAGDFADIARELHEEPDLAQTLDRIVELACESVECDSAGVFLLHGRQRVESAAVTDPTVEKADRLQLECGMGPCLEAMADHETIVIHDTATDPRWNAWSAQVAEIGYRSVLSIRLFTNQYTIGSLNLYARRPAAFGADEAAVGQIFGGHASVALAAARNEDSLRQAIDARHVIGQAQGILMERFDLNADQAFSVLRRYSQDKNLKLRAVAEEMIASRVLPS